ncbi:MAG: serine/threonine-protein kinase, partial [Planctomycetota bacterium]
NASRSAELETHLEHCEDCRQIVEQILHDDDAAAAIPGLAIQHDAADGLGIPSLRDVESRYLARQPFPEVPGYEITGLTGHGGMGLVYAAKQTGKLQRRVAIKIIRPGLLDARRVQRFDREQQALAELIHPNIARVLHSGQMRDGRPFFVMEFVDGANLRRFCKQHSPSIRSRLELVCLLCHAMQHAHTNGIAHRDLKPENVLIQIVKQDPPRDPPDIIPKIIDFGLAANLNFDSPESQRLTRDGTIMGTEAYMSPEQANDGQRINVDARTDVYSLAVLCYELLVGKTPLECIADSNAGRDTRLRHIRETDAPRPSDIVRNDPSDEMDEHLRRIGMPRQRLTAELHADLDWILLRGLEKEPNRRYATANALAADIQRYLNGESVEARPPSRIYSLHKLYRKNRAVVWVATCMVGLLMAGIVGTTYGLFVARAAATTARQTADRERETRKLAQSLATKETTARLQAEQAQQLVQERADSLAESIAIIQSVVSDIDPLTADPDRRTNVLFLLRQLGQQLESAELGDTDESLRLQIATAEAQMNLGNFADAIPLLRRCIDVLSQRDSKQSSDVQTSRLILSKALAGTGRLQEAQDIQLELFKYYKQKHGLSHPRTRACGHYLAAGLNRAGHYENALEMYQQVLQRYDPDIHGHEMVMVDARHVMGQTHMGLKNYRDAELAFTAAISELRTAFDIPQTHPLIMRMEQDLAQSESRQGKSQSAIQRLRRILAESESRFPAGSKPIGKARLNLATTLANHDQMDESERLLRKNATSQLAPLYVYHSQLELVTVLRKTHRDTQAQSLLDKIKPEILQSFPSTHANVRLLQRLIQTDQQAP